MSSGRVTDQNPFSSGNSSISEVQCTGQLARSSLNSSCGGPFSHRSRSRTRTSFSEAGEVAIPASYRRLDTLSVLAGRRGVLTLMFGRRRGPARAALRAARRRCRRGSLATDDRLRVADVDVLVAFRADDTNGRPVTAGLVQQ